MPAAQLPADVPGSHRALAKHSRAAAGFRPGEAGRECSRFAGRCDEYVDAARPKRARLDEGIEQLPPALARPG